jgi:hypothetical protein
MSQEGKYIYGVIEEAQAKRFGFPGVEDVEVYAINYQRLAAIVSDIELKELDPTRKNVLAHTLVQDGLLKEYDLLPTGFGMIAINEDEVRKLLEENYNGLVRELERLSGKIEAELKVFWDQEAMMKELEGETEELSKIKERIKAASSPIEAQNLMIESGKLVERVAVTWKTKYGQRAYNRLKELSLDACENNTVGVKNILNASFLIDRSREGEFQEELNKLDSEYRGKVNFKYVGPLPPYNFAKLKLKPVK